MSKLVRKMSQQMVDNLFSAVFETLKENEEKVEREEIDGADLFAILMTANVNFTANMLKKMASHSNGTELEIYEQYINAMKSLRSQFKDSDADHHCEDCQDMSEDELRNELKKELITLLKKIAS
jgi:hypothetical protein